MQVFALMEDIQNIKLRQYNKNVEFMFYSISSKDHTSAFVTKHFYSSQRGIMFAKKCLKWLRIARLTSNASELLLNWTKTINTKPNYPSDKPTTLPIFVKGFFWLQENQNIMVSIIHSMLCSSLRLFSFCKQRKDHRSRGIFLSQKKPTGVCWFLCVWDCWFLNILLVLRET